MADNTIPQFVSGVHNLIDSENTPADSASDSLNWITEDGSIFLTHGKAIVGAEGAQGPNQGLHFGYKADGTTVMWRKNNTRIQYFDGTTWQDTITGLTASYEYVFTNYSSLAGNFTFAIGLDGIYKMHNGNPSSYISLYDSSKNQKFRGAFIDKGRMIAWGSERDRTGLYGSRIDGQDSTVYTTVSAEVLGASGNATYSGTLAFKAGGATRNAFGLVVTGTTGGGVETFTDNYNGVLTGSLGGTGTVNYVSGAYSVTFNGVVTAGNVTADYQWENANALGVTDFTKSGTRLPGEGFVLRQDEGGDPILNVLLGLDGAYYSLKSRSAYRLLLDPTDEDPDNQVFRRDIGIPYFRAAVSTQKGIVFLNTGNPNAPELTILQQNPIGGNVEPFPLFPQFNFADYEHDNTVLDTNGQFVVVSCKTLGADSNDTTLLCDLTQNTVDITNYGAATFAKDAGNLYIGSPVSESVYQIFVDFDDDGVEIDNNWTGMDDKFKTENLKKYRKLRLGGLIDPTQSYEVYISYDKGDFNLVGTVLGTGEYVDTTSPQTIGGNMVGDEMVGGSDLITVYPYYHELKLKTPKFKTRKLRFVALGFGYVSINKAIDHDVFLFEDRMPRRLRVKQNVSLDGTQTDLPNPEF